MKNEWPHPVRGFSLVILVALLHGCITDDSKDFREIRISIDLGPKHPVVVQGYGPYARRLHELSGGSLKVKRFLGGTLLTFNATLDGVRAGLADAGLFVLTYYPAEFPHFKFLSDLAVNGHDALVMSAATTEYVLLQCAECLEEFRAQNIVHLGSYSTPSFTLTSTTKIVTKEDLRGKKIRVPGPAWNRLFEHLGATTVNLPANEQFSALSQGVIDATIQTSSALRAYSLWDVAKHHTRLRLGTFNATSITGYNGKFWRSLRTRERKAIIDSTATAIVGSAYGYHQEEAAVLQQAPRHGISIYQPAPLLTDTIRKFLKTNMDDILREAKENGIGGAEEKAEHFLALVEEWTRLLGPLRADPQRVEQVLRHRVFDELDPDSYGLR